LHLWSDNEDTGIHTEEGKKMADLADLLCYAVGIIPCYVSENITKVNGNKSKV